MKVKSFFAASLLVAGAAFADSTTVETEYVLGVMPVSVGSGQQDVILSIPWVEAGSNSEGVAVSNLVKTAGLTTGDTLLWYDGSKYQAWAIDSTTNWTPTVISEVSGLADSIAATTTDLNRGQALVLHRQGTSEGKVYVVGQYLKGTTSSTIASGSYKAPKYSLIAPTSTSGVNLNTALAGVSKTEGDEVSFVNSSGQFKTYSYHITNDTGAWGTWSLDLTGSFPRAVFTPVVESSNMDLPAGTGFYYKRCGEQASVTW